MSESKERLYVERDGFCAEASMLLMALAVVFRLIGSIGRWDDMHYLLTQVALPVFSGLLFLLCLLLFSRRAFWTTVVPVVLGAVFFIFRIMSVENEWQIVGCIVLYVAIVVIFALCFYRKNLKWALAAILLLAFAYHVAIEDLPVLMDLEHPVSFVDGMQEMSLLGIILSLLSVSLAMKMSSKPDAKPEEEPQPAPEQPPVEEKKPAPEQPPVEEKKPAGEKRFGWGKKTPKEPKPAEEPKPAPEPEPAGELPPTEIWSAQPASAPEPVQTPVETVIVPESHSYAEPVQVLPLEEPEQACDETPAEDSGRSEA